jgi:DNA-binding MarR family transcriptional regulator
MRNIPHPADPGLSTQARTIRERLFALARRRTLRDPLAASCRDLDLTPPQIHALLWLGHDGPLTMGELARRVGVTEKTVTGLVDRLERDGQVARERDAEDRRVVRARLTPGGAALHRRIDGDMERGVVQLLALLDAPDRKALARILEKLLARLAQAEVPTRSTAVRRKERGT